MDPRPALPFAASGDDLVQLVVVDLGVARAFWEGVPTARILARIRLHRDERDLVDHDERASGVDFADASWDMALARIVASSPPSFERIKRAVARHARAASDEGPLAATDYAIAALVHACLSSADEEASPAEGVATRAPVDDLVARACRRIDDRLGRAEADTRAPVFEACLELATRAVSGEQPLDALRATLSNAVVASAAPLYPWGEHDVPVVERRACLVDRSDIERVLLRASIVTDVLSVLQKQGATILVAVREPRSSRAGEPPRLPPASWFPADIGNPDAARSLASALERGATTAPRVRSLVLRSGHAALDAISKEMLAAAEHPFASEVFAGILAGASRDRDAVRLVAYFATAPDPTRAAAALSECTSREVPTLLRAWLESILPADEAHGAAGGEATSPRARLASCIRALSPYPTLYEAVEPLLSRLGGLAP